jgi:hypothetical protein
MPDNVSMKQQPENGCMIVSYWLDREDRITKVNPLWDQFALANGGENRLLSSEIQGRRVFDFITGDQTRMYLEALLQHARFLNRSVSRSYRCDSPTMKRFMSMCLTPASEGLVQLDHTLLKSEPFQQPIIYHHEPDPQAAALPRCSVCTRLLIKENWLSPEDAETLGFLIPGKPLPVTYRICPACRRKQPRQRTSAALRNP